jgi:hypothetical protein
VNVFSTSSGVALNTALRYRHLGRRTPQGNFISFAHNDLIGFDHPDLIVFAHSDLIGFVFAHSDLTGFAQMCSRAKKDHCVVEQDVKWLHP